MMELAVFSATGDLSTPHDVRVNVEITEPERIRPAIADFDSSYGPVAGGIRYVKVTTSATAAYDLLSDPTAEQIGQAVLDLISEHPDGVIIIQDAYAYPGIPKTKQDDA
jgi:hypothetical protein